MMLPEAAASIAHGRSLSAAKTAASASDPYAIIQASRQLESVFIGQMLNAMAETVDGEDLFGASPGIDMAQGWLRTEIAQRWATSGGAGLGDRIAQKVGGAPVVLALSSGGQTPPPPVEGRVSSPFGMRLHPVTAELTHHDGVDIAVSIGTPVRASFAGTVVEVTDRPKLGRTLVLRHAGGYRSVFGHIDTALVLPGTVVKAGQVVARSGNSGRSTGPHLHFGLYQNGRAVDPGQWIPSLRPSQVSPPAKKTSGERQVFDAPSDRDRGGRSPV
ncbi:MAG: peptidoglycan DD-metalloendopeptidase family protein [Myxococcota bacterium]